MCNMDVTFVRNTNDYFAVVKMGCVDELIKENILKHINSLLNDALKSVKYIKVI